ncbi:MAG: UPF0149 family protein [Gammaproteobacteria bacterium]|jgi:uncharacterized protein YgfB (UPF0149 family)
MKTKPFNMLEYDDLNKLLRNANAETCAAECHGFLCGQICIAGFADTRQWHDYLAVRVDDTAPARECFEGIHSLIGEMLVLIASPDFDFQLLLPDDAAPLVDRVEALGEWCHGFLNGFGMSPNNRTALINDECEELIEDFSKICRVGVQEGGSGEEDEQALVELVEYVRLGVVSLFESLQPAGSGPGVLH